MKFESGHQLPFISHTLFVNMVKRLGRKISLDPARFRVPVNMGLFSRKDLVRPFSDDFLVEKQRGRMALAGKLFRFLSEELRIRKVVLWRPMFNNKVEIFYEGDGGTSVHLCK